MKLVKKSRLQFIEGSSDKLYEVDLCELPGSREERFLVNFRYGRRGRALREGTKTPDPVNLEMAQKLFDSVVVSKTNKGYVDMDSAPEPVAVPSEAPDDLAFSPVPILLEKLATEKSSKVRSRIIWRLGEVAGPEVGAVIAAYIGRGDWLEDYSIAWALGRMRAVNQLADIDRLMQSKHSNVQKIALEAKLLLEPTHTHQELLSRQIASLPEPLKAAIEINQAGEIEKALAQALDTDDNNALLVTCYQLSLSIVALHESLLTQLATLRLVPGNFKGIRSIFKAAECRLDVKMLALLSYRIEMSPYFFRYEWDWAYVPGIGGIQTKKELKKPNSRLAYSHRTRDYFRRRSWRVLRRLGQANDSNYVPLAAELLMNVKDEDGGTPRELPIYRWARVDGRWQNQLVATNRYDRFASFLAFNHILFGGGDDYRLAPSRRVWLKINEPRGQRSESFPHLWDQKPEYAWQLLKGSACEWVHRFARRVLKDHASFCDTLDLVDVCTLLQSRYDETCEFALQWIKTKLAGARHIDDELLLALLSSALPDAQSLGLEYLDIRSVSRNEALLAKIILIPHQKVIQHVLEASAQLSLTARDQESILLSIIREMQRGMSEEQGEHVAEFAIRYLAEGIQRLSLAQIDNIISRDDFGSQLLGARLLAAYDIRFSEIPRTLLDRLHDSQLLSVQAIATSLLNKQSDEELAVQMPYIVDLYQKESEASGKALLNILQRLARTQADELLQCLMSLLFKTEPREGQHQEVIGFIQAHLSNALQLLNKDVLWRLLQAKTNAAQQVGALALAYKQAGDFSVKQWALMSYHCDVSVREYGFEAYRQNVVRIKRHTRDALRIIESPWEDAKHFGFEFFREQYQQHEWSVEAIIFICDSVQDDVQRYGRELLQTYFEQNQGPEYLEKLSQHPSANVQLFVSSFLQDHASGSPDRILALRHYFKTMLTQVNRGRICKDRVTQFLLQEAQKNRPVAEMAMDLFAEVSLTVVHKDKAALITGMLQLQRLYPDLPCPLSAKSTVIKQFA